MRREVKTGRFRIKVPFCQNDYYLAMHITPTRATHATHAHTIVRSNNTVCVAPVKLAMVWVVMVAHERGGDGRRRSATAAVRYDLLGSLRATSLLLAAANEKLAENSARSTGVRVTEPAA